MDTPDSSLTAGVPGRKAVNGAAAPPGQLAWTGERFVPSLSGQIALEHLHRYALACGLAGGKRVLDVACGEGYGTALLAGSALSVTGVDVDAAAIAHASGKYGNASTRFLQGSCTSLPLPDACMDLVVSFETVEHVDDHEAFFAEIERVLTPEGLLLISSPDKAEYERGRSEPNPFHVHELTRDAFEQALRARFRNVSMAGQRIVAGSAIFASGEDAEAPGRYVVRFGSGDFFRLESAPALPAGLYCVALCSNGPLPPMTVGLFENPEESAQVWDRAELYAQGRTEKQVAEAAGLRMQLQSVQNKLDKAKRAHAAEKLKLTAVTGSGAFGAGVALGRVFGAMKKPWDVVYRLFRRTRRLTFDTPLPACFGFDGVAIVEGSYRLREDAPAPVLLLRAGGRTWDCKVEPVKKKKGDKRPPREFRFSCVFTVPSGPHLLQLLDSRPYLRTKEILASSIVWGGASAPGPFRRMAGKRLSFESAGEPLVSIVIPIHGNLDLTLRCLGSVMAGTTGVDYEVIIGDDPSPENAAEGLGGIPGLRIARNPGAHGFLPNCNQAAASARGRYLLFLNNDTEVRSGWLPPLLETFAAFPDAGAAGSKLLNAGHSLQEAGGIIWEDASGWNYGRDDDPDKPEYNYLKEADYCSAASLLVERKLFESVGAFSPEFSPGY